MRRPAIAALFAAALVAGGCATHRDGHHRGYGDYDYRGADYERLGNRCGAFGGPGGERLDPWLACTEEGEDLVRTMFTGGRGGLDEAEADRANIWFRRHADTNRDMCLTDPEIKAALVNHARHVGLRR
jgi:hypothetical protein